MSRYLEKRKEQTLLEIAKETLWQEKNEYYILSWVYFLW